MVDSSGAGVAQLRASFRYPGKKCRTSLTSFISLFYWFFCQCSYLQIPMAHLYKFCQSLGLYFFLCVHLAELILFLENDHQFLVKRAITEYTIVEMHSTCYLYWGNLIFFNLKKSCFNKFMECLATFWRYFEQLWQKITKVKILVYLSNKHQLFFFLLPLPSEAHRADVGLKSFRCVNFELFIYFISGKVYSTYLSTCKVN